MKLGAGTPLWATSAGGGAGDDEVGVPLRGARCDGDGGASATVGGGGPSGAGANLWLSVSSFGDTGFDPAAEGGMGAGGSAG